MFSSIECRHISSNDPKLAMRLSQLISSCDRVCRRDNLKPGRRRRWSCPPTQAFPRALAGPRRAHFLAPNRRSVYARTLAVEVIVPMVDQIRAILDIYFLAAAGAARCNIHD